MVARCSKCDFRNLGIIWDRNRWSGKKNVETFFGKTSKYQNFEFSLPFSTNFFFGQKSKNYGPQKKSTNVFGFFFRQNVFDTFFSDHLFRSQMIQRFRKSHLEQRATIIKIRTARTKKKLIVFCSIYHLATLRFVNLLYSFALTMSVEKLY